MNRKTLFVIRLVLYSLVGILLYNIPLSYIESRSFCFLYNLTGIKCFGCGLTRAFFNMIHFNFSKSLSYNYSIIIWMGIMLYITLEDVILNIKNSKEISRDNSRYSLIEKIIFKLLKIF